MWNCRAWYNGRPAGRTLQILVFSIVVVYLVFYRYEVIFLTGINPETVPVHDYLRMIHTHKSFKFQNKTKSYSRALLHRRSVRAEINVNVSPISQVKLNITVYKTT